MPLLEFRTAMVIIGGQGLVAFLGFLFLYLTRRTYAGFSLWLLSTLLMSLGLALLGVQPRVHPLLGIILANALNLGSQTVLLSGLRAFLGLPLQFWRTHFPVLIVLVVFPFLTFVVPSFHARLGIISLLHGWVALRCVQDLYNHLPSVAGERNVFLQGSLGILGIAFLLRIPASLLMEKSRVALVAPSVVESLLLVVLAFSFVGVNFGLLLINSQRVEFDLRRAQEEVRILKGVIPICAACKKIRDDAGAWQILEGYIREHSEAEFSHGMCPDCMKDYYPEDGEQEAAGE